jgi:hypothetical protein
MLFRIGEFARRGRVSVKAVRHAGDSRLDLTEIQFPLRPATGAIA